MKKIKIIFFAVLFIISTAILILFYYLNNELNNEESIDSEYAISSFEQNIVIREFEFSEFDRLYFLNDHDPLTKFSKKTKILGATPILKIINSDEYRVEIKANADVFDSLKIATSDSSNDERSTLIITFSDECYVPVHTDDTSYDYDTGLYIDFDVFEVTVYAPISSLSVDSEVILDYQAPKCEKMHVDFSFEGTTANIYDINTEDFTLYCSGTSDITLSGKVKGESRISVWHETKVNANDLDTDTKDFHVSSSVLFGLSYIKYNGILHLDILENSFGLILAAILYLPPIIWLGCLIGCFRKKRA